MVLSLTIGGCLKIMIIMVFYLVAKNIINNLMSRFCPICKTDK